ncbi:MAG: FAD-dependent oxidoreductase [Elusimicrobiales bacterium]|nr:FAD-dependent oxidoreductase [Elusimicrobiales bacterium]
MLIIIGAGLTGLSCALKLGRRKKYILLEKENTPGGLCRTLQKDGFLFDFSGHLLHLRWDNTRDFVLKTLKGNLVKIKREAKIYFKGNLIDYPFQINLYNLPKKIISECVKEFIEAKIKDEKPDLLNFKDWTEKTFGKGISKYFMIPYNEKLYACKASEMTALWTNGFVPVPKISDVIKGAYIKKVEHTGYNPNFYYPKYGGIQTLVNSIYEKVKSNTYLSSKVKSINFNSKKITLTNGREIKYTKLISTMPLKELILISDAPKEIKDKALKLKNNTIYILNLGIKNKLPPIHWIYFPHKDTPFYRLGIYTNFSKYLAPKNYSSIYIEFSINEKEIPNLKFWMNKTIKILKKLNFIKEKKDILISMWTKIECAYVVYNKDRDNSVKKINDFLKSKDTISIGRYGGWKYSFMEENIKDGFNAAEEILK